MIVRQLTPAGLGQFSDDLAGRRSNPDAQTDPPTHLLTGKTATALSVTLDAKPRTFADRRDAAEYLHRLLEPLPAGEVVANAGLWSWLARYYFDQLCQARAGLRVVKNGYYYLYDPASGLYPYRHLLFAACQSWRYARTLVSRPGSSWWQQVSTP